MKKIPSLFQRNYDTDRLVRDEVVPGSEWVLAGEGVATVKIDGTACMIKDGKLYKRYDRKPLKHKSVLLSALTKGLSELVTEYKSAPAGWIPCEDGPDENTGHWPGWLPVGDGPDDKWHRDVFIPSTGFSDGTYELVGPKVQGNPYGLDGHALLRHGEPLEPEPNRTFEGLKGWFNTTVEGEPDGRVVHPIEGIVWHHPDGRMVKIKRKDFGLPWPVKT